MFRALTCSKMTHQDEFAENVIHLFSAFCIFTLVLVNSSLRLYISKKRQAFHRQLFSNVDRTFRVLGTPVSWALLPSSADFVVYHRTTEWLMLKKTLPKVPGFSSSFVRIHPLLWQMTPIITDLSILPYERQAVLLPGSADPSPASVIVLHLVPNLHHAWLTASPVISRMGTRAEREWRIKQVCSKHFPTKSLFFKRVCGNGTVHIKKCHETFISALHYNTVCLGVSCKIHRAKIGYL